jgi:predicted HTH transcriptional regulator
MALLHIVLDQINQPQLQRLIDGRAVETRDIEYKRETYGDRDKDHGEFLPDISSFANTSGGDIIIGMIANSGVPTDFNPLKMDTADSEILRLEQIARSGLQPRIFGLDFRAVQVTEGAVIVIRIPRSYNSPHRIIRNGSGQHRFFARSSAGKYEPNVD